MRRFQMFALALGLGLLLAARPVLAQPSGAERILSFSSRVEVLPDASLIVTETIRVMALGQEIKRGIFRDFPTLYTDDQGRQTRVGFRFVEASRDGRPEPWHEQGLSNGVRVSLGKKDVFLKPGPYTYVLKYWTDRQIGFFPGFDELYWNVTGNGWIFPMDRVEAEVVLPSGAESVRHTAYTGPQGATGRDFTASVPRPGVVAFASTRPLAAREGLTVAVAWPKGFVTEPPEPAPQAKAPAGPSPGETGMDGRPLRLPDMRLALGLLVLLLAYYVGAWLRVGRDPEGGPVIPLYAPPRGYSPSACRYILNMGYDGKAFSSAVVDLAVKGALAIEEVDGAYTLRRTGEGRDLSPSEARVRDALFSRGPELELDNANHAVVGKAVKTLRTNLGVEFGKSYFKKNYGWLAGGLGLSLALLGALAWGARDRAGATFMSVWLLIWTVACYVLCLSVNRAWKTSKVKGLFMGLFALPFVLGDLAGLFFYSTMVSAPATLILGAAATANALFAHLLKAPTLEGRALMDRIQGFRMFLGVAEKDRMNLLNPPERTPELFEKFLPYALALDVENEWCEQFAGVLAAAAQAPGGYHPLWYAGSHFHTDNMSGFADGLGSSLDGAISSASAAPGSSSGSGGGGSSGGGGGGGGGGGW